ncbi:MAG: sigma-70 family RNA polymerase sigma factor [Gammaproteobacteria bacterium]|nr:sigma-70 family RNA polymerase sigma factor [Gammaproteobacteria bacterium]
MRESDEQRWSALMVSAQSGNESDYRQLLGELTDVIQRFLRSRFGNRPVIEDCVQEALIAIHKARHTYNPKRPFRPWLFAIVRNKTIDTLRKQRQRENLAKRYRREQEVLARPSGQVAYPQELAGGPLFRSLSNQHREVLVLTKIIGFSIAETAEKLHISESAVKVRVHRAVGKLRKMMKEEEW